MRVFAHAVAPAVPCRGAGGLKTGLVLSCLVWNVARQCNVLKDIGFQASVVMLKRKGATTMTMQLAKRLPRDILAMVACAAVEAAQETQQNNVRELAVAMAAKGIADVLLAGDNIAGLIVPAGYFEAVAAPAVANAMRAAAR